MLRKTTKNLTQGSRCLSLDSRLEPPERSVIAKLTGHTVVTKQCLVEMDNDTVIWRIRHNPWGQVTTLNVRISHFSRSVTVYFLRRCSNSRTRENGRGRGSVRSSLSWELAHCTSIKSAYSFTKRLNLLLSEWELVCTLFCIFKGRDHLQDLGVDGKIISE